MKRNLISLLLVIVMVLSTVAGCATKEDTTDTATTKTTATEEKSTEAETEEKNVAELEPITLTMTTNVVGEHADILEGFAREYEAMNPHVTIDFSAPGGEYENLMKVKMAANDMPDIFSTHGWAKNRYGEFLADLSGREWAGSVMEAFAPIVTSDEGALLVLPFDQDQSGPVYNVAIFEEYGIEVPATLDEMMAACETILTESGGEITPIFCAAEGWQEAQYFDFFATPLLISPEDNYADALLDGSFDWSNWDYLPEKWLEMWDKGYINEDIFTAKFDDNVTSFASGKAAIGFFGAYMIEEAKKVNPEFKGDMMPIPSIYADDEPTWVGGEKTTLGVWKDSDNVEEAMAFLDFCSAKERVEAVCSYTKLPPAIEGAAMNAGDLTETYAKYSNLRTFPYFDRVYIANGMWDVMCKNSQALLGGAITPAEFSADMESENTRLSKLAE